jgi:hypothetical protein
MKQVANLGASSQIAQDLTAGAQGKYLHAVRCEVAVQ